MELIRHGAKKAIVAGVMGTPLHQAAEGGHVSTVKAMLEEGCPVDVVDKDGCSVLLAAAVNDNAEMIREIVSTPGCDINAADRSHMTPLHKVAQHGKTEAALELIRHGAKKALASHKLGTPLHVAAVSRHVSTVKAMLRVGCPVDVVNNEGYSVLHFAAQGGNAEVVRELLSTGCDMNAAANDGRTPLHVAARKGNTEAALELIRQGAEKAIVAGGAGTPLHQAAVGGHVSTVKAMLEAGCPVDVVDSNSGSVLHFAAQGGNAEVVRVVLSTGCDMNAAANDGRTPLHVAAVNGCTEAALELIRHGAKKAIVAGVMGTPLHQAAGGGHVSTVKAMLRAGCPVDVVDSNSGSVLHAAAAGGNAEVVREVLSTGCDMNTACSDGRTPLHVAAVKGNTEASLELIRHGAEKAIVVGKTGAPLHQAAEGGHVSTVKAMLEAGCPVDVLDSDGNSVLHFAAQGGNAEVVRVVLSTGCDMNAAANDGTTPLHVAAVKGCTEAALELIRHGAEKAIVAGAGATPLHQAAVGGHVSTVKAMLEAGCPVDVVDRNCWSVLHAAAGGGNAEVIREVCSTGCDINALTGINSVTPLHTAVNNGHTEAALELIRLGAEKAIVAGQFGTPLHQAVLGAYAFTVKTLLKAGCPVDVVCTTGATVLHWAAEGGSVEVIREVLSTNKCNINAIANDGETPLHVAAWKGNTEAAMVLIRHGAEKAIVAGAAGTPLHHAAGGGHVSTVKAMLEAGCPVDVVSSIGISVLHAASMYGYVEVMDMLLSRGCDVNATDYRGNTPLDYAALAGEVNAVLKLIRHGADKNTTGGTYGGPVLAAAASHHWSTVQVMLDEGFPADGVATDGQTLLHIVAAGGNVTLLQQLAKGGFSVSRMDHYDLTPLHYAIWCESVPCFKILMELGANAQIEAPLLGTALDIHRFRGFQISGDLLHGAVLFHVGRPLDEMIVDFALCKELGINIESPYLFSEHKSTISVFEFHLFRSTLHTLHNEKQQMVQNKVRTPSNLRKVLSVLSKHQLVDLSKLACLAAIHGDVAVLTCLSEVLSAPTEPVQLFNRLKQLFPASFRQPESVLAQVLPECKLNPLQLAVISMLCTQTVSHPCMHSSSHKYTEVISFLTTNDSFCHTLNECLPNGLSPLDLAEQLGLEEAVTIISSAGGTQGIWALIPEEVRVQHGPAVLDLHQRLMQLMSSGPLGQQAVQAVLSKLLGKSTTAEQGTVTEESHLHQQKVLTQRPDLIVIVKAVLPKVQLENWKEIGIMLQVPIPTLNELKHSQTRLRDKYREVLEYWLDHNKAASWRTLLEVLGHFETKVTMDQLTQEIIASQDSEVSRMAIATGFFLDLWYHSCFYYYADVLQYYVVHTQFPN